MPNVNYKSNQNTSSYLCRHELSSLGIRRYVKIKADANPYLPEYAGYFWRRRNKKDSKLLPAMSAREFRAMAQT